MAVEGVSELEYAPHNAEALEFRCGIVLLSWAESTAPIANRESSTVRLLLQQGASELVQSFGLWPLAGPKLVVREALAVGRRRPRGLRRLVLVSPGAPPRGSLR